MSAMIIRKHILLRWLTPDDGDLPVSLLRGHGVAPLRILQQYSS